MAGAAEAVKDAIASRSADQTTVRLLQELLQVSSIAQTDEQQGGSTNSSRSKPGARKPTVVKQAKSVKSSGLSKNVLVLEDGEFTLSPKQKCALTTEVINLSLRSLQEIAKTRTTTKADVEQIIGQPVSATVPLNQRRVLDSDRALKSVDGNAVYIPSDLAHSEETPKDGPNQCSRRVPDDKDVATCIAECARTSFSYLRSAEAKNNNPKSSDLQLTTGRLALVARLIALDLRSAAIQELTSIKARLQSKRSHSKGAPLRPNDHCSATTKDVLAGLLHVDVDFDQESDTLPLVLTYHAHVLRIISLRSKSAVTTEVVQCLRMTTPSSPANAILRQCKLSGDLEKSIKCLESLSRTLTNLATSTAQHRDKATEDHSRAPTLHLALELQYIALEAQLEIYRLANHKIDWQKEIVRPFSRALSTALQASNSDEEASQIYAICNSYYDFISAKIPHDAHEFRLLADFATCRNMYTIAEQLSLNADRDLWVQRAERNCNGLSSADARNALLSARKLSILLTSASDQDNVQALVEELSQTVRKGTTGAALDYEMIIIDMVQLFKVCKSSRRDQACSVKLGHLYEAAALFALRFTRTFPTREVDGVLKIFTEAIAQAESSEGLSHWFSKDAAQAMIRAGILHSMAADLSAKALASAWSSSRAVIAFGRGLKALTMKTLRSHSADSIAQAFDDTTLELDLRGALLEWQLKCACDLAHKTRHRAALQVLLHDLLQRLSTVYPAAEYPLRRARVATIASQIYEDHLDSLAHAAVDALSDEYVIDTGDLRKDQGLAAYAGHTAAMLRLTRVLNADQRSPQTILSHVQHWCDSIELPESKIDDVQATICLLKGVESYFDALGDYAAKLTIASVIARVQEAENAPAAEQCLSILNVARANVLLQRQLPSNLALQKVDSIIGGSLDEMDSSVLLQYHLCRAELYMAEGDKNNCRDALQSVQAVWKSAHERHPTLQNGTNGRIIFGRSWLSTSESAFATGSWYQALYAAKAAVKIMNSIWASVSCQAQKDAFEKDISDVDSVAAKVRKLNLVATVNGETKASTTHDKRGAVRWPIIPWLCRALLHTSKIYQHHGVFPEARYYSEQALKIAESIGHCQLLSRVKCRHVRLLAQGGCLADAQVLLATDERDWPAPSLIQIEQLRVRAFVANKDGAYTEADELYAEALRNLEMLVLEKDSDGPAESTSEPTNSVRRPRKVVSGKTKVLKTGTAAKKSVSKKCDDEPQDDHTSKGKCALRQLRAELIEEQNNVALDIDNDSADTLSPSVDGITEAGSFRRRQQIYHHALRKAADTFERDFPFTGLPESTISLPAAASPAQPQTALVTKPSRTHPSRKGDNKKTSKTTKSDARNNLTGDADQLVIRTTILHDCELLTVDTTYEVHIESAILAKTSLLLSVDSTIDHNARPTSAQVARTIELSRMNATRSYARAIVVDREQPQLSQIPEWPGDSIVYPTTELSDGDFQAQYVDILPRTWTAVSLTLDEACEELCLVRYRQARPPLVIRLPFARHRADMAEKDDEAPFDFHMGKAELKEIVDLSNFSCHNAGDTSAKGAKAKWWTERAALDRRLQDLLINIESLWLGGFRGAFCQRNRSMDEFARFRKAFDTLLDRHLPSRSSQRRVGSTFSIDDQILELFLGLGSDDQQDLDEPLSDLLYFIVDTLQFRGERNAYDEIDFDAMAVDVLDAIRAYHDAISTDDECSTHLILVLDRRLHAFPWESLPCLEGANISRVDSLLTLRDRIAEMKACQGTELQTPIESLLHTVSRASGSYILNPSKDLKATESALGPALSTLTKRPESSWTSVIRRAPEEEEIVSALSQSSMLLYFGHGAGSQYVRTRAIRRLDRCSEVVWLMGCSSGAVTEYDEFEPSMVPLAYLAAGQKQAEPDNTAWATSITAQTDLKHRDTTQQTCKAVVATLWDVTDKDIDRFSLAIGEEWGLWDSPAEPSQPTAKPAQRKERIADPSTPPRQLKTPRAPKVQPTPAPQRTPERRRRRVAGDKKKISLVEAVARGRDACYLRYLNGAAPVVYGVPVYLGE